MLSEKLAEALSDQVNAEFYSAYLYLAMSSAANNMGLKGVANWLYVQTQEEMAHGLNMHQYLIERSAVPLYSSIEQPPASYSSANEIFEAVLAHERKVSGRINTLATLAMQENDHAFYQFMMWYVNEQVEEESGVKDVLDRLHYIGDNKGLLLTLDTELAARVFVDPFPSATN